MKENWLRIISDKALSNKFVQIMNITSTANRCKLMARKKEKLDKKKHELHE